jgi:hypothetical protein
VMFFDADVLFRARFTVMISPTRALVSGERRRSKEPWHRRSASRRSSNPGLRLYVWLRRHIVLDRELLARRRRFHAVHERRSSVRVGSKRTTLSLKLKPVIFFTTSVTPGRSPSELARLLQ